MLYIILGLIALGAVGTGVGYWKGGSDAVAAYQVKEQQAQQKIDNQAKKLEDDAANKIIDMEAAFEQGQAESKTITRTVYAKGQSDVTKYPVFVNPVCVLPDDSLHNINAARTHLLAAADTAGTPATVPAASAVGRRQDSNVVPNDAGGRGPVVGVQQPTASVGGGGSVSRQPVQKHPKPIAIK